MSLDGKWFLLESQVTEYGLKMIDLCTGLSLICNRCNRRGRRLLVRKASPSPRPTRLSVTDMLFTIGKSTSGPSSTPPCADLTPYDSDGTPQVLSSDTLVTYIVATRSGASFLVRSVPLLFSKLSSLFCSRRTILPTLRHRANTSCH